LKTIITKVESHVVTVGIKACRNQNQIRFKIICRSNEYLSKCLFEGDISGVFGNRHIDIIAFAKPTPNFLEMTGTKVKRCGAVGIKEQDIEISPENILSPAAMTGIPVNDKNKLTTEFSLSRRYRDIVKQSKAVRSNRFGVMARRSKQRKCTL
jgi:hypothetical protein